MKTNNVISKAKVIVVESLFTRKKCHAAFETKHGLATHGMTIPCSSTKAKKLPLKQPQKARHLTVTYFPKEERREVKKCRKLNNATNVFKEEMKTEDVVKTEIFQEIDEAGFKTESWNEIKTEPLNEVKIKPEAVDEVKIKPLDQIATPENGQTKWYMENIVSPAPSNQYENKIWGCWPFK